MNHSSYPDLNRLRAVFPVTDRCAYLNHAAIAPLSDPVREAMQAYLAHRAEWHEANPYGDVSTDLRAALASLVNAAPEEIAFVQNTSQGLNVIANALPLQPGDNVVYCDMEFPSNVYPWMNLEYRGIEARCIPHDSGGLTVDALDASGDASTRVVAVSSVEFLTGFRTDLAAIAEWCRRHRAYFVVDAIQSLGVLPMDVQAAGIDFLSCGGPKWLMGPAGQGFIYVRSALLDDLRPPFAGCISVSGWEDWRDYDLTFLPDACRFELGCANVVGQVGLLAAVQLLLDVGIDAVGRWTLHLTDRLIQDLQSRGYPIVSNLAPERRSAIVSFRVPGGVGQALERLTAENVVVARREELIRVSPHGYNTEKEILRVGEVLGRAQAN